MHAHPTTYNLNKKTFLCETTNMLILRCHVTSQLKKKNEYLWKRRGW